MSNDNKDNIDYLYIEYIKELDPTEYYYATRVFKSWSLWEQFVEDNYLAVSSWRRELEAKIKSMCLSHLIETSKGETRDAIQAAKFLLDAPWKDEEKTRGRPSKVEIDNELKSQAETHQRIKEDLARINHASS